MKKLILLFIILLSCSTPYSRTDAYYETVAGHIARTVLSGDCNSKCISSIYQSSEGVCNACLSFDFQKKIDWNQRKSDLLKIISEKNLDKNKWNCIDHDGLMKGYDNELIQLASSLVNVPIIASGGAGNYEHFYEAYKNGADAFAAASIYHFTKHTPAEAKKYLVNKGVPIRENFII